MSPQFADIEGQPQAVEVLRRAAGGNRMAHAYLFAGPLGVGKATSARIMAAALNCENTPGEGCRDPGCDSCHKFEHGHHPDLIVLRAEGMYIKIDQVRAVEEMLSFAPHEGRHRMVLIDGADQLNTNAANALLKSVEEPRPRTMFVLSSAAPHRVTPTLVSRCQRVRFVPLPTDVVLRLLKRHSEASDEECQAAAALAEGSVQRAMRLLEGDQISSLNELVGDLVQAAQGNSATAIFDAAAGGGRDRQVISDSLDLLRIQLRDLLLIKEGAAAPPVTPGADQLRQRAQELPLGAILGQLRAVDEAQAAVRGNVHPALALENLVLSMRECETRRQHHER